MLLAYKAALASPLVRASAVEAIEFPALADSMDVWAVPRIVVNGVPQWDGAVRDDELDGPLERVEEVANLRFLLRPEDRHSAGL